MSRTDRLDLENMLATAFEVEPGFWSAMSHEDDPSYPESGHSNLASIEDDSFWFRHRAAVLTDVLEKHPPTGPFFDIGGGNGHMVRSLGEAGYEAVLVEPGEHGCSTALARGLSPVLWGTTADLGISEGSLPAVGLFDVVEHVPDDGGFLSHIFDLMMPSGRLYMMVPAFQVLWSASDVKAGHFRRYRAKTARQLIFDAGFDIEYVTYLFRVLTVPLLLRRAIPYRIGLDPGRAGTTDAHRLPAGTIGKWVERSLERERARIRSGKVVGWGTSALIVASKP